MHTLLNCRRVALRIWMNLQQPSCCTILELGGTDAHRTLVHLGIPQALLDGFHAPPKEVHIQLFKAGACYAAVEVYAFVQGVNLNAGLRGC